MPPLESKRILVTRPVHQASELASRLEALGALAITIPTIEIIPPESYEPLDLALATLETYDWLVFTSANAVEVFHQRCDPASLPKRIAVIGQATARAVQGIGLSVDLIPPKYIAESLAEALVSQVAGKRVLLVRAAEARDILPEALTAAGATVTIAEAYRNRIPPESIPALRQLFASSATYPDAITFTSASTVRNLVALLEAAHLTLPAGVILASIGPITSRSLRNLGYAPQLEAAEATIAALTQTLIEHFNPNQ